MKTEKLSIREKERKKNRKLKTNKSPTISIIRYYNDAQSGNNDSYIDSDMSIVVCMVIAWCKL